MTAVDTTPLGATPAALPNVIQALALVRADLPAIAKDDSSEQGYKYRGIEAITKEVGPLLGRHGVVIVPHVDEWSETELTINGRPWTDQRLTVTYTIWGPAMDSITAGPIIAIGRDNSDKGGNKALTQAFKYLLLQLFAIGDQASDADRDVARERDSRNPWADAGWFDGKAEHDAAWANAKARVAELELPKEVVAAKWAEFGLRLPLTRSDMDRWAEAVEELGMGAPPADDGAMPIAWARFLSLEGATLVRAVELLVPGGFVDDEGDPFIPPSDWLDSDVVTFNAILDRAERETAKDPT